MTCSSLCQTCRPLFPGICFKIAISGQPMSIPIYRSDLGQLQGLDVTQRLYDRIAALIECKLRSRYVHASRIRETLRKRVCRITC
jgi:hypothetical protein